MQVRSVAASVYKIPTDQVEADGTFIWDATVMVLAEVTAADGTLGIGFSYASRAAAVIIDDLLGSEVCGRDADDTGGCWEAMVRKVRNIGREGVASTAIAAVDIALWDLKAKCHVQPLFTMLGAVRTAVPVYGSGGFTTYSNKRLAQQLGDWVAQGIPRVKMKIGASWGTKPQEDVERVRVAREAIGPAAELFVDANGAYTVKQAIGQAERFAEHGVNYFEEPVSSDHLEQLRFVREHVPMDVAAGEYAWDPWYIRRMLAAGAVDLIQADVTRCLGVTGWLQAASIAHGFATPLSAHCSPSIHAQVGCAAPQLSHVEYFHDHVRIEQMLFDGAPVPRGGCLSPDPSRPGLGLELKRAEAERWRIG